MTQPENTTIRRRPDGSIDISFYARKATRKRRAAMHRLPLSWFRYAARSLARAVWHRPSVDTVPPRPVLRYTGSPQN